MTATIRAGTPADVAALRALNDASLEVLYDDAFYSSLFPPGEGAYVFVACAPGGLVCGGLTARLVAPHAAGGGGLWAWLCGRRPSPPPAAYIMSLCVAPAARRQGLARGLVRALVAHLAAVREVSGAAPVGAVELHVLASNAAAQALYAGLGFARVAAVPAYYHFQGGYHDAVLMRLQLEGAGERAAAAAEEMEGGQRAWTPFGWLLEPLLFGRGK